MTTLLALDAAGDCCSVALLHAGDLDVLRGAPGQNHLEHVQPMIEQMLARHALVPGACDAFAFGSGPGSFTGLRVACTLAQGLAYGCGRPVIAVGNLEALAQQAAGTVDPAIGAGGTLRILAAVDARMGQAYWSVLEGAAGYWRELAPPGLCAAGELAALAAAWAPQLCAGRRAWLQGLDGLAGLHLCDAQADAQAIVQLARTRFAAGAVQAPQQAAPAYVRDDVARTVAQRRAAAQGA